METWIKCVKFIHRIWATLRRGERATGARSQAAHTLRWEWGLQSEAVSEEKEGGPLIIGTYTYEKKASHSRVFVYVSRTLIYGRGRKRRHSSGRVFGVFLSLTSPGLVFPPPLLFFLLLLLLLLRPFTLASLYLSFCLFCVFSVPLACSTSSRVQRSTTRHPCLAAPLLLCRAVHHNSFRSTNSIIPSSTLLPPHSQCLSSSEVSCPRKQNVLVAS